MIHHIAVRGVDRRPIFLDDEDREDLLLRLDRIAPESGAECLAWALIPNHYHLVVRRGPTTISRFMSRIETGYARRFNERHGRVGHLSQNRFLSRPIEDDGDLMGVIRYVHANPIRHGLVDGLAALERFRWCGHAALTGNAQPRRFHAISSALSAFGSTSAAARAALRRWMSRGEELVPDRPAEADGVERLLVEACASRSANDRMPPIDEATLDGLVRRASRVLGVPLPVLRSPAKNPAAVEARALISHLARTRLGASNRDVARALGISERASARGAALGVSLARSRGAAVDRILSN